jgi:hypothetical protein
MVVVQDEGEFSRQGSYLIDQGGYHRFDARRLRRTQRG